MIARRRHATTPRSGDPARCMVRRAAHPGLPPSVFPLALIAPGDYVGCQARVPARRPMRTLMPRPWLRGIGVGLPGRQRHFRVGFPHLRVPDVDDPRDRLAIKNTVARLGLLSVAGAGIAYPLAAASKLWSVPSQAFWTTWTPVLVVLPTLGFWASAGRIEALQRRVLAREETAREIAVEAAIDRGRLSRELEREQRKYHLDLACRWLLVGLSQQTKLPLDSFGASVWRLPRQGETERLRRVIHGPVEPRRASRMSWTQGKGVVGRTWEREEEVLIDLTPLRLVDQPSFEALPPQERLNMSWIEFARTSSYYTCWAIPLYADKEGEEQMLGILSVDCKDPNSLKPIIKAIPRVGGLVDAVYGHFAAWHEKDGPIQ
jgi:hypothetical protein